MFYAYRLISWIYVLVPLVAVAITAYRVRRTGSVAPFRSLLNLCLMGAGVGAGVVGSYIVIGGARVPIGQVAIACYGGVAAILLLRGLNAAAAWLTLRAFRIDSKTGRACCAGAQVAAIVVQAAIVFGIGLPYLVSLGIIYRPKAIEVGDPQTLLGAPFETVAFAATDGVPLEAWWIPAKRSSRTDGRGSLAWGTGTVILCPGFGADKSTRLQMVRDLVPNGFNVLALDLRAHGRSGGQFTTFGDAERRDVLGAVRWVRATHPGACRRILGLGESLGAAALIAAAADPGPEGQSIDGIAAYNPFDRLDALADAEADRHLAAPAAWVASHMALPIAGAQMGTSPRRFSPAECVQQLWPRPILVICGRVIRGMEPDRSQQLFDASLQPHYFYRADDIDRDRLLQDDKAALAVRIFFSEERSIL